VARAVFATTDLHGHLLCLALTSQLLSLQERGRKVETTSLWYYEEQRKPTLMALSIGRTREILLIRVAFPVSPVALLGG